MQKQKFSKEVQDWSKELMGKNRHERRRLGKILKTKIPGTTEPLRNSDKPQKRGIIAKILGM